MGHQVPQDQSLENLTRELQIASALQSRAKLEEASVGPWNKPAMPSQKNVPPMMNELKQKQTQNIIKTLNNLGHPLPTNMSLDSLEQELEIALAGT